MTVPTRVLHVVTRAQRRGAEASGFELAHRLRSIGYCTEVVALSPAQEDPALSVESLGTSTLGPRTLRELRRRVVRADVVIAHGSRTLPAVVLASFGLGSRLVYQNIGDPGYWATTPAKRWRVRAQLARMSGVAALTEQSKVALSNDFGVPEERLHVIPNWRDAERFRPPTPEERVAARRAFGVSASQPVACVVGALSVEKDVGLAIRAARRTPGLRLLVAGDGPERAQLEALAGGARSSSVTFLGAVEDVRPVLHASDVLLLTSISEGVPGAVIEAGLCSLPVVTTQVGFVSDVVVDQMTGLIVRDRDPASVSSALTTAMGMRAEWGPPARARCRAKFDSAVVTEQWRTLIDHLAEAP